MKNKIILALTLTLLISTLAACSTTKEPTPDNNTGDITDNTQTPTSINFEDTYNEMLALYGAEDMWPNNAVLDKQMLLDTYGIDEADLEDWYATMPLVNIQVDEFFMAKVKPGKIDAVEARLKERASALDTQWATYLVDKYELVKNYKIVKQGDHILFVVSEQADKVVDLFNNKF